MAKRRGRKQKVSGCPVGSKYQSRTKKGKKRCHKKKGAARRAAGKGGHVKTIC